MLIGTYADWVRGEVLGKAPEDWMATWRRGWQGVFDALVQQEAIFELISIVSARWEFLGALYEGTEGKSDVAQAIAYVAKFLEPINRDYAGIHNMTGSRAGGSDFFTMLRNKPLHGMTPAAAAIPGDREVIGWQIGVHLPSPREHLKMDAEKRIGVDGTKLRDELLSSMDDFRAYISQNADQLHGRLPADRWKRGFWARFTPRNVSTKKWMSQGYGRDIPR
jgi:hypothetical protein